ncbi:MAG: sialate O-acetylesterase [Lentisphaeria bacterium]|nr:sialate O-acetylesterase [Lentisphaeria bacterium]
MHRLLKTFTLITMAAASAITCASAAGKPLKVYILVGQSNMQGQAQKWGMPGMAADTAYKELYDKIMDENGEFRVHENIHVAALSGGESPTTKSGPLTLGFGGELTGSPEAKGKNALRFGPELGFGITMHEQLNEPILIIKAAWGGKNLNTDFRPPSAGKWTPPEGHVDAKRGPVFPIPKTFELPADFTPPTGRGSHMQLRPMRGIQLPKMHGIYPLYIESAPEQMFEGEPFRVGDIIIGINGNGLGESPSVKKGWRNAYFNALENDWMLSITRLRDGRIETVDVDLVEGGRANLAREKAQRDAGRKEVLGAYYREMMKHVKTVLADIKSYCPTYNPEQGYEIAGFVWFQGWNDLSDAVTYPNYDKPGGYDQYSWLLSHFIRDVRAELNAPDMPFVIGVLGVGGYQNPPYDKTGYFQQAMAAPAMCPEFKGNVVAVQTGNYWDEKLEGLLGKKDKTPEDEAYIKQNSFNRSYHYLGSAKTFSRIGEAFANAIVKIDKGDLDD